MTTQEVRSPADPPLAAQPPSIFRRVLIGVDSSSESGDAVRQGAALVDPGGALTLLAAWTLPPPIVGADGTPPLDGDVSRQVAEDAVRRARELAPFCPAKA